MRLGLRSAGVTHLLFLQPLRVSLPTAVKPPHLPPLDSDTLLFFHKSHIRSTAPPPLPPTPLFHSQLSSPPIVLLAHTLFSSVRLPPNRHSPPVFFSSSLFVSPALRRRRLERRRLETAAHLQEQRVMGRLDFTAAVLFFPAPRTPAVTIEMMRGTLYDSDCDELQSVGVSDTHEKNRKNHQ